MITIYSKVADGSWALKSIVELVPGQIVSVEKRDGSVKRETCGKLIYAIGTDTFVYAIDRPGAGAVRQVTAIGSLAGVLALFAKAKESRLKRPAVVLHVPGVGELKITMAGERARVPGSLNVATNAKFGEGTWYGRILANGTFEASPRDATPAGLIDGLTAFAAEPAKVAAEHGRLTGRCCFCNLALTDERSTAVGYGQTCARKWGLVWGKSHTVFECSAA
jgi:hypothetical protein